MSIDVVYLKSAQISDFEEKLRKFGIVTTAVGEDRRSFLMALSEAVGRSDVIITVGEISSLAKVLSKGLSMPLAPVNWDAIGISGDADVALPQGSLPLIVDGSVYGMIIESASQCIIAMDDDKAVIDYLSDTYISSYLDAICSADESVAEPSIEKEEEYPEIQPVEHFEELEANELEQAEDTDLFADIEEEDFVVIDDRRRKKGWLVAVIIVLAVVIAAAVGGFFGYTKWWQPKQYDDVNEAALKMYSSGSLEIGSIPAEYALRFGELYNKNDDIIGWISADGISIEAPIVTEAGAEDGYYSNHLFDGSLNAYGTAHIKYAYDTVTNVNPNLVVYGNNFGDGRAFSDIEKLLDSNVASAVTLHTDSVFYGEDTWELVSVMTVNEDGSEYNFADNFATLTAEQRLEQVKIALSLSRVALGKTEADFANIGLSDTFLTLVAPYSEDSNKAVVAFAVRVKTGNENSTPIVENEPADDASSEASSNTSSDTVSSEAE